MHVSTTRRHYVGKDGDERTYETHLLRRSVREGSKVRNETLANLSHLPEEIIEAIKAGLSGETLVVAGSGFDLTRSLPHGHLAAVSVMAKSLGLRELLGPPCKRTRHRLHGDLGPGGASSSEVGHDEVVERHHLGGRPRARLDWHR